METTYTNQLKLQFEYPFHRYLLYLTLCQAPIEDIKNLVKSLCHTELTKGDIETWQSHINTYIDDTKILNALKQKKKLPKTLINKVMGKYGLIDMWKFEPNKSSKIHNAYKIALSDESLILNILSLKGLNVEEIVRLYGECYNAMKNTSIDTVKLYYHYFWDISNLDNADWSHLLPRIENEKYYHLAIRADIDFIKWLLNLPHKKMELFQFLQDNLKNLTHLMGTSKEWSEDYSKALSLFFEHNPPPPIVPDYIEEINNTTIVYKTSEELGIEENPDLGT